MSSAVEYSPQDLWVLVRQSIEGVMLAQVREVLAGQLRNQLGCLRVLVVLINILNLPNKVSDAVLCLLYTSPSPRD